MTVLRGLIGVLVALAVSVGFVQILELMLANAIAGRPLQSMGDYATVLNALPVLGIRLVVTSFVALLGGMSAFGLIGLVFGPVVVAVGAALLNAYLRPVPATSEPL